MTGINYVDRRKVLTESQSINVVAVYILFFGWILTLNEEAWKESCSRSIHFQVEYFEGDCVQI